MSQPDLVPTLAILTLLAGVVVAAIILFRFLRKPSNRHPMDSPAGKAADEDRRREAEANRVEAHRSEL
jgi:hypothetical protein